MSKRTTSGRRPSSSESPGTASAESQKGVRRWHWAALTIVLSGLAIWWYSPPAAALIPVLGAVAASTSLYLSKPERPNLAVIAAVLILLSAGYQLFNDQQNSSRDAVRTEQAVRVLWGETGAFLGFLGTALAHGSEGWSPNSEDEFYSAKAADVLCRGLNVDAAAPISPPGPWWAYGAVTSQRYLDALARTSAESATILDASLLMHLYRVQNSLFLNLLRQYPMAKESDRVHGFVRPPLMCNGIESHVARNLDELQQLVLALRPKAESLNLYTVNDGLRLAGLSHWRGASRNEPVIITAPKGRLP